MLQRQEERIALNNWQNLWSRNSGREGSGDGKEVPEMATNYLRRGSHNDFVEKFIAAKQLARQKKASLKDVRAKMRAEKRNAEEDVKMTSRTIKGLSYKEYLEKCLGLKRLRVEARVAREKEEQIRTETEEKKLKADREEKRRLRIMELSSAKVRY